LVNDQHSLPVKTIAFLKAENLILMTQPDHSFLSIYQKSTCAQTKALVRFPPAQLQSDYYLINGWS
jgi:hypothetical protein